ncbi:universal stress protein [Frankia sp. Cj5]|uniref:universal stress protein n=1 Tax=Frankia sp. Cj5 TaxID=2880978 RepID=UPI001EF669E2|nr:universal stress protein [Frankia sp. Cj5]
MGVLRGRGMAGSFPFPTRVLVPLDGSPAAARALDPAVLIARQLDCPLELVTVYDPVRGEWARDLDAVAETVDYDRVEVALVGSGWPGDVIVEMAADQPGTLVCMAAQHQDHVDRLILGSVSTHVIRRGNHPLLLVGPGYQPALAPPRYRRLLVCLDGSPHAAGALTAVETWARHTGMEIELVHVAAPTDDPSAVDTTEQQLARTVEALAAGNLAATHTLLTGTDPAERIAHLLTSRPGAIAVTTSHGRTGLAHLLLGGVTVDLLTRSPAPLLLTRTT